MKKLCTLLLIIMGMSATGQNPMIQHGSYSPLTSALSNPAGLVNSNVFAEYNLVSSYVMFKNNYLFLPDATRRRKIHDNTQKEKVNLYGEADILLPSFMKSHERYSVGMLIRSRNHVMVRNAPVDLAKFAFEGFQYQPQHNTQFEGSNYYIKGMAWGEIGLSYARILQQFGDFMMYGGVTGKVLNGFGYFGMRFDDFAYEADSFNITIPRVSGNYAYAVPDFGRGYGFGVDLGINMVVFLDDNLGYFTPHSTKSACQKKAYKTKFGISLLDIGFIPFDNGVFRRTITNQSFDWTSYTDFEVDGLSTFDFFTTEMMKTSGAEFQTEDKFRAWLPTSLFANYDYNFENGWFVNGAALIGFRMPRWHGAERMSMLNVSARYEKELWSFQAPFTFYRYQAPGLGISARFIFLEFGTTNILPWIFKFNAYGADAYFSLKIPIYYSVGCRDYLRERHRLLRGKTKWSLRRQRKPPSRRYF